MLTDMDPYSFWQRHTKILPFAQLARWDRPVGIWLLYWPCVWGLFLADSFRLLTSIGQVSFLALFFIGAIAMRGAGCTLNDLLDRHLDAKVARTKDRPLPSGRISVAAAIIFLVVQLVAGAAVLLQLSPVAWVLGAACVPLMVLYPLMKRFTFWPQLMLGVVFNAGVLIAFATLENTLTWSVFLVYLGAVLWTLAYDTIYAFLDVGDDAQAGIKSTALLWGPAAKTIIGWLWVASSAFFAGGLWLTQGFGWLTYAMILLQLVVNLVGHAFWDISNDRYSLGYFRMQTRIGLLFALAVAAPLVF